MRSLFEFSCYISSLLLVLVLSVSISSELLAMEPEELEDAEIRIETNATDGDSGLQIFADGDPWKQIKVTGPNGNIVYSVSNKGQLKKLGSTEFFTESNEPNYADVPLPEILSFMPEGDYEFEGFTIENKKIVGSAELTHNLPCAPVITSPTGMGAVVNPNMPVISWTKVTNKIDTSSPTGECGDDEIGEIIQYELIVEILETEPEQKLTVIIPPMYNSYEFSQDFVMPGYDYKFEVIAREESGNQTITEGEFTMDD
jgi:hypothetical protein